MAFLRYSPTFSGTPESDISNHRTPLADSVTIKVPPMAESISEGTLKQWLKEVGEQVEQDEEIATIETDKIDVAVNAPQAGILKELLVEADTTVTVGQDLARLEPGEGAPKPAKEETKKEEPAPSPPPKKTEESKPAEKAPQPKKVAEKPKAETSPPPTTHSAPAADGIGNRGEQRVKMNRMRLRTGERLKQSQNTAASLTTFNEVDMSAVMEMRSLYKNVVLEKTGVKLGFVSFFTKACILAMKDVPVVNASIEGPNGGDTIVYRDYVDVSIAVATEKGLVTPVIRNAETLDLVGIDKAISELGEKARHGKITLEDLAGGTFTISNGGVFGSLMGTPIINLPQSAVLGLHATKQRPVVVNGKIEIRPMMYLALTYDHRLLDGREAVTFLVKVKEYIEDPRRMLLP
ncbi:2-oxoglutarate dehydrogenase complex E2 component, variant 2 [Orbilia oligospora]|nr:2-oxoglutarate dehydrogenase complex E2 component, variant 2 [Orbilia oligospora]KAF3123725.1 2-oxoglutarate dehydrogenase complex E2 component, variant 2 [Orbilia oligospora]KAF3158452.1 2-oxoglutarate dehydrogenase complex E2 component, variant 2 [Orbilia oligospora]KAF3168472.1 2-oxoglutarate dehydrogenase complex E2 component, variant 2 [Orbilia oligospora]KAF3235995.1 2-oxoglutarate dehydrogenase complex E2 component, variant 2 [Orbilia oligospora]